MKKFLVKIALFFIAVAIIDIIFGKCCDYMYEHSQGGDTRKINYAVRECTADVIVMGSSRANHHYNPQILSDSLGMSVYNLGIDGSGIILMDGLYELISQRYIPQVIIYELTPSFDFEINYADANDTRYLTHLKPYYREVCLKQLFDDVDSRERFKLYSGLYRYNTSYLNLFRFYYSGGGEGNGYSPLDGVMTNWKSFIIPQQVQIDSLKVQYMHKFIRDCKSRGTKLVFSVSPRFGASTSIGYQPGFEICKEEGCLVLDFFCDTSFVSTVEYYNDSYHLNSQGADAYTKVLANKLKTIIK